MAGNFGKVNVSIAASTGGLTRGLASAQRQLGNFASKIGSVLRSLAAPLLVLTSVASAVAAFGRTASEIDEASKAARRLGMETSTFQTLGAVAEESGVSISQMSTMMTFMTRNLGNLANGSKAAQNAFANIGLTLAQLQGLAPEQQFTLIAQRIAALPTAAERTAAAMAIFGRSGAMALGMIEDVANGAYAEMEKLRQAAGVNVTDEQAKGVEMMNDAWGRTGIVVQGFITQLVAGVAPAITTMSNLFTEFSTKNAQGWSLAEMAAAAFSGTIRLVVGGVTMLYGVMQMISGGWALIGSAGLAAFSLLLTGMGSVQEGIAMLLDGLGYVAKGLVDMVMAPIKGIMNTVADMAEAVGATDIAADLRFGAQLADGLTEGWENFGDVVRGENFFEDAAAAASAESEVWASAANTLFAQGAENFMNPFAAYDNEFANVTNEIKRAGQEAGQAQASEVVAAVKASSESLKAMVLGTADAESYRNRIAMGFDPRDAKDDTKRTADNTERAADGIDELNENLAGMGLATAGIMV